MFKKLLLGGLLCVSPSLFAHMEAAEATMAPLALDLSPQTLYANAHIVVKIVVLILLACSVITWAIALFKSSQLISQLRKVKKDLQHLGQYQTFAQIKQAGNWQCANAFVDEISQEIEASHAIFDEDLKQRLAFRLNQRLTQFSKKMRAGISPLATVGSVTPFIGLFGTVWGIMNSFIGIAQTKSTDLFAVAPGIAEALFATALGLVAAIPAVIIYNIFLRYIQHYADQLQNVTALLQLAIRREMSINQRGTNDAA